jgi:hypothetical protein
MNAKTENHAEENANGWADTIVEMYQAYQALDSGDEETAEVDGEEFTDSDEVRVRAQESVLEVQVRGSWHAPGETDGDQETEYYILLSTGGPALRLYGDLNSGQPSGRPRMQHQDWGTPWTDIEPESDEWSDAVDWFVNCFYFGE